MQRKTQRTQPPLMKTKAKNKSNSFGDLKDDEVGINLFVASEELSKKNR